ncbi:MAG TPA: ABC transporter permease [Clostridia bacterium]|nr:ABC transporter permease [Clostridia bacterium]
MQANVFLQAWKFLNMRSDFVLSTLLSHIKLVFYASLLAVAVGVPIGILIYNKKRVKDAVLGLVGVLYTIPVIAMFGILIPLMGIGTRPALLALVIYGILPIIRNTAVGLMQVSPAVKEAAVGMGANRLQVLLRAELPLALPVIFAGIRTSVVMNFSMATYAVFIGGGGMGSIIMQGMRTYNTGMLLGSTILVALATVILDRLLGVAEKGIGERFALTPVKRKKVKTWYTARGKTAGTKKAA